MKKYHALLALTLSVFTTGCSLSQSQINTPNSDYKLEKNRDYLATVSRTNTLHIVDAQERKLIKSCELEDEYGPGGLIISKDGTKAYVMQNRWQSVYGYDLNTCENFFQANFSADNVRSLSMMSFSLSKDQKQLYTISNPTEMNIDSYKVLEPVFNVYNIKDGLNAKPVNSFKAPRQISIMATSHDDHVYASGPDIYKINPRTGEVGVAAKLRNWDKANYTQPDVLAMWPIGNVSNEFMLMNTAAKFTDKEQNIENAEFKWGATRIDLTTGEVEQADFAPIESIMFSGMTHPKDSNILYGVLTDLTKFDRKNEKVLKRVYLDHSYYCINFATDGSEIYLGGTYNDIAVYDPETLEKKAKIFLPDGDVGAGTLQVFRVN